MRLTILAAAVAASLLPMFAPAAHAWDRGYHQDRRVEVFYRDSCRVERVWRSNGRYSENIDCSRPRHHGRGHDGGWRDRHDDDRSWRESRNWRDDRHWRGDRGYDSRSVGAWFDDRRRSVVGRYYGRDCHPYRADWGRPYRLGHEYPRGHHWGAVSADLYRRLGPPPRGYVYGRHNDDVLLIREATRLVVDAILLNERRHRW
jgi:hypothetical protein